MDDALAAIEEALERHLVVLGNLRRVLLQAFPYAVYFKVFPAVISVVGTIVEADERASVLILLTSR